MGYLYLKEDYTRMLDFGQAGISQEYYGERGHIMSEQIEGRNAVLEAFPFRQMCRQAFYSGWLSGWSGKNVLLERHRKTDTIINYVAKERLDQLSETGMPIRA